MDENYNEDIVYESTTMTINYRINDNEAWHVYADDEVVAVSDKATIVHISVDIDDVKNSLYFQYANDETWIDVEQEKGGIRLIISRNHSQNDRVAIIWFSVPHDNTLLKRFTIQQEGEEYLVGFGDVKRRVKVEPSDGKPASYEYEDVPYDYTETPRIIHLPPQQPVEDEGKNTGAYQPIVLSIPMRVDGGRRGANIIISKVRKDTVFNEYEGEYTTWTPINNDSSINLTSIEISNDDPENGMREYDVTLSASGNLDTLMYDVHYAYLVKAVHKDNARFVFDEILIDYRKPEEEGQPIAPAPVRNETTDIPIQSEDEIGQYTEEAEIAPAVPQPAQSEQPIEYLEIKGIGDVTRYELYSESEVCEGEQAEPHSSSLYVVTGKNTHPSIDTTCNFMEFEWGDISTEVTDGDGKKRHQFQLTYSVPHGEGVLPTSLDRTAKITLSSTTYPTLYKVFYVTWKKGKKPCKKT